MSSSRSSSKSDQHTSTVNTSTNLNVQDTEGVTLAQSDGNTITTTDHGAIQIGGDIASDSLAFATDAIGDVLSSNDRAGERLSTAVNDALSFGKVALQGITGSTEDALTFGKSLFLGATDLIGSAYEDAYQTAGDVLKSGQANVASTVSNLNAISRQASTSDAERNQSIVKYALIAATVMVLAFSLRGMAR